MSVIESAPILNVVYIEIGRGHPFYLDGAVESLRQRAPDFRLRCIDIRQISKGTPHLLWKLVDRLYRIGSRGRLAASAYSLVRRQRDPGKKGIIEMALGRDLRQYCLRTNGAYLVSHPLLVPMIAPGNLIYYQHGEIAAPAESAVEEANTIFVPLNSTKAEFIKRGIKSDRLIVTGLCIEESLVRQADSCFNDRIKRLHGHEPLTGAFYSSGAEPPPHIQKISLALKSLQQNGQSAIVFCRAGGRLENELRKKLGLYVIETSAQVEPPAIVPESGRIHVFSYKNRAEEDRLTALFFGRFDYLVAPSHERSNWAVGLGLPQFILYPLIGPYAPLNRQFLLDNIVASDLRDDSSASAFAQTLSSLQKTGKLDRMALSSYGKYNIDGFRTIADYIVSNLEPK